MDLINQLRDSFDKADRKRAFREEHGKTIEKWVREQVRDKQMTDSAAKKKARSMADSALVRLRSFEAEREAALARGYRIAGDPQ